MNLRTLAFAAIGTIAFGTSAVSFAQPAPGPNGTPPPPPVPGQTSSPLISTSAEPTALPSNEAPPTTPGMTPAAPGGTTPTPPAEPLPATLAQPGTSALPSASPSSSPQGKGRHRSAATPKPDTSPSETPEPPQFSTLDGVWEIALQPLNGARTKYSHLYVSQSGNALTGTWRRDKTALPFTGTFDGRLFKLSVTDGSKTEQLSGYAENYMDMVGLFSAGDPKVAGTPFTAGHRKSQKERDRDLDQATPRPLPSGSPPVP